MKLEHVSKRFVLGKNIVQALSNVSFEIHTGEYVMLYGPSGCGKSTLLHIIAGLERPTSGHVFIRGENIFDLSQNRMAEYRRYKIGIVFQQFNLIHSLHALDNVSLPLALQNIPISIRTRRAKEILESFGLLKHFYQKPQELSGGQQQSVAIARALITHPWIILADEPTGNVDSQTASEIMNLFHTLNKESKRTILLVTHNPDYLHYADRVFYIRDGQLIKEEKVELTGEAQKELREREEIKRLLRKYTRIQLNDMAIHYGLHGESFRNRVELATQIAKNKERGEGETEMRLKQILSRYENIPPANNPMNNKRSKF